MPSERARNWCFTLNNPATDNLPRLLVLERTDIGYAIWQLEQGSTIHVQGYVRFTKNKRLCALQELLRGAHAAICRGSEAQNIAYCTKEETRVSGPYEIGVRIAQGKRSDILRLRDGIKEGSTDLMLINDDETCGAFARSMKFVDRCRYLFAKKRDFKSFVICIYGPTDIGKSRVAAAVSPNAYRFSNNKGAWFDYYDGVSDIIFDDFYGGIPRHQLLQLLDRYPTTVESKGGTINWCPKVIIITSNKPPWEWYRDHEGEFQPWDAIKRRLDFYVEQTNDLDVDYWVAQCLNAIN